MAKNGPGNNGNRKNGNIATQRPNPNLSLPFFPDPFFLCRFSVAVFSIALFANYRRADIQFYQCTTEAVSLGSSIPIYYYYYRYNSESIHIYFFVKLKSSIWLTFSQINMIADIQIAGHFVFTINGIALPKWYSKKSHLSCCSCNVPIKMTSNQRGYAQTFGSEKCDYQRTTFFWTYHPTWRRLKN